MPFFTIFTATYNRAYILPELYHSLCKQSCQDFEWLIVDDGSQDDTASLVKSWMEQDSKISIRYYYKSNEGKPRAINYGVGLAKGQYFFMVDSDDMLLSDAVEKMKNWCLEIDADHHFISSEKDIIACDYTSSHNRLDSVFQARNFLLLVHHLNNHTHI